MKSLHVAYAAASWALLAASCGGSSPGSPDGGPDAPDPDGSPDGGDCVGADCPPPVCDRPTIERRDDLEHFAPFASAQAGWATTMAAATTQRARPPLPPFLSPADPLNYPFWAEYVSGYVGAGEPAGFHPFGQPPPVAVIGHERRLADHGSLVLAEDRPGALLRLTDFSTAAGGRYAAACDAFLAAAGDPAVSSLQRLCEQLGTTVLIRAVTDLKVDAIRLVRGKECAVPSLAYGALPDDASGRLGFTWPDFASRAAAVQQPCVGAFLRVAADGDAGARGWLFAKAVADLAVVPFPHIERDPIHGTLPAPDGAPRGEYVSTRQLFESGISMYLGTSPLWLLPTDTLDQPHDQLAAHFDAGAPACDLSEPPTAPCILPPQQPFLFPTLSRGLWLRQALDATRPGWKPLAELGRNPAETFDGLVAVRRMLTEMLQLFAETTFTGRSEAELSAIAERLAAVFHVLRPYQGRADFARLRIAVTEIDGGYLLAIPDQGYLQIGTPTPALYQRLTTVDLGAALDLDQPACSSEPFRFQDLAP